MDKVLPGKVELVIAGGYELGEAPHWDERTKTLLYVDCSTSTVYRWDPITGKIKSYQLEDPNVGCVVPRERGDGLVVAAGHRFALVDENGGRTRTLASIEPEHTGTNFNDGKCDPRGRFWAGTMGEMKVLGQPRPKQGRVYCLHGDGRCSEKRTEKIDISNGISWSSDNKTMYHIDSLKFSVDAYDYDVESGDVSNCRSVIEFERTEGLPDGQCLDRDGNMWVAMHGGGCVIKIDPRTGKRLGKVAIGASRVTSACFGGDDYDVMYVTTARSSEEKAGGDDGGGGVFRVTGLGVKGAPARRYCG